MKLITYLTPGVKFFPVPAMPVPPAGAEGEILREAAYQYLYCSIVRYRQPGADAWKWYGIETDGRQVWYYEITPDENGDVLAPGATKKRGRLPGFSHGPAYEYMIEQICPLAVDDSSWIISPKDDDEKSDLAKWRAKLTKKG